VKEQLEKEGNNMTSVHYGARRLKEKETQREGHRGMKQKDDKNRDKGRRCHGLNRFGADLGGMKKEETLKREKGRGIDLF